MNITRERVLENPFALDGQTADIFSLINGTLSVILDKFTVSDASLSRDKVLRHARYVRFKTSK